MVESKVSIGQVKREISELLNRVAFGGERIVLTSRGKPKAVIVSLDDYELIQQSEAAHRNDHWDTWLTENAKLTANILKENSGEYLDVDKVWGEARTDLEERHDYLLDD